MGGFLRGFPLLWLAVASVPVDAGEADSAPSPEFAVIVDGLDQRGTGGMTDREFAERIRSAYREWRVSRVTGAVAELADAQLREVEEAVGTVAFYSAGGSTGVWLDELKAVHGELQRRGLASSTDIRNLHDTLITVRQFDEARTLARQHPALELPSLTVGDDQALVAPGQRVLEIESASAVRTTRLDLSGARILVIAHPHCGFSRRAIAAIEGDPVLAALFRERAAWMTDVGSGHPELEAMLQWNAEHPHARLGIAYSRDDFPMLPGWGLPSFYFLVDGKVESVIEGWPAEGRHQALLSAAGRIGLTDGP
jgi:hypothetical protein